MLRSLGEYSAVRFVNFLKNLEHLDSLLLVFLYSQFVGKFQTDQQSLDEAEAQGHCPSILPLPSNHLLFAKDYIGWFFTSGHTFIHVTGIGRLHEQVLETEVIIVSFESDVDLISIVL